MLALGWILLQAAPADLLTREESQGVQAMVSTMVAAGFPDAAGAEVHFGTLDIAASFDPAKTPGPFPSVVPMTQNSVSGSPLVTFGYTFYGLHLKLADGSWIVQLSYRYRPSERDRMDLTNGPRVDLANLTAASATLKPFHAETEAAHWLDRIPPSERARLAKAMDVVVPVTFRLKLDARALAPAIGLLYRAGWPDAATATLSLADQRARNYWQIHFWAEPDGPFDPTGANPRSTEWETEWRVTHPQVDPEPPQVALRRAIFEWARNQILAESAMLSPETAAAVSRASLDPKDPQNNLARIDALLAGSRLPVVPAEGADLAARLASWEARPRLPKMKVPQPGAPPSDPFFSDFEPVVVAYMPERKDLDFLVAMLSDERPSRFLEMSGPRTVGDNAWRALSALLKCDPRTLAHHPVDRPWTASERKAAALAVQRWWKEHRREYTENS